ncbi:hypothetical protein GOODEAATRI_020450 [Goodea atripinnis]|uniref:Secreted protein n=1 Tax=Goodea atripinnis TaxID=208336 RepID=A0ABV0NNF1_9TELE
MMRAGAVCVWGGAFFLLPSQDVFLICRCLSFSAYTDIFCQRLHCSGPVITGRVCVSGIAVSETLCWRLVPSSLLRVSHKGISHVLVLFSTYFSFSVFNKHFEPSVCQRSV